MIHLFDEPYVIEGDSLLTRKDALAKGIDLKSARDNTLAARILRAHNIAKTSEEGLRLRFDAMASHDITYVGIIQTARASGLKEFPLPYVLTNCHNSLCAVGGTINEDDHCFGLSAAHKYGGIYVPPHMAVIHQYMRETMAGCGKMILGSDSHTRYGALGTMGIGEGGPELVKQLLRKTYDIPRPEVIAVWLTGEPKPGVGPQDVAIALIGAVFKSGFVKNKVLEFHGPGVGGLSVEFRCGIDVMTTETTCLSSVWCTDERVRQYMALHGREGDYRKLEITAPAAYDGAVWIDLSSIVPMIALPYHPSNAFPIADVIAHPDEILGAVDADAEKRFGAIGRNLCLRGKFHDGGVWADQGIIAGCAGGMFENITLASAVLEGQSTGNGQFALSLYPSSEPLALALVRNGSYAKAMAAGAVIKTAFCGPCFGAGDVPANGELSLRHSTRNFPNREGAKPTNGQIAAVALMDARSIAATAIRGGKLTPATDLDWEAVKADLAYAFDAGVYERRVYHGFGRAEAGSKLVLGPNITDWPSMSSLPKNLLLRIASHITDPVTTTDDLIPSGETSSLRSNPLKLAEHTLGIKDPAYVGRAKDFQKFETARLADAGDAGALALVETLCGRMGEEGKAVRGGMRDLRDMGFGTAVFALKPGDGSAREQAASSQKVLGGWANIAVEYATKRYRSNLINWGMLPFTVDAGMSDSYNVGDYLLLPDIRKAVEEGKTEIKGVLCVSDGQGGITDTRTVSLSLSALTEDERRIILAGSLINFYNEDAARQGRQ